ncbi:flagellar protein FlaG [Pseudomarimonas salicorniae]|uniref:Flagellar protein FlaG n=1 Tax=Pseudomarimonas salicorniae TaxID=2933270 RepID=A0ABT0GKU4_9GAMM|nr:flagellar protein FlaG [Lysobacter sp. CAU 1642]MCK7595159.1 flagellar protein FlaG [Lysobacter sp. CAU 1642]
MASGIPPISTATPAYGTPGSGSLPDARSLQRFLDNATAGTQLRFRVDSDVGRVVVQVLDVQSGEVVRQIPREEALQLARDALDSRDRQA